MQLPVEKLHPFEGHPFQVKDDAEMDQPVWSILTQGLRTPITVQPLENDEYEGISGHRRLHACQKAGIETVPALIYSLDRDAAAIAQLSAVELSFLTKQDLLETILKLLSDYPRKRQRAQER